ncbi:MAG: major capsid protein [Pseudomonadales bacterium]
MFKTLSRSIGASAAIGVLSVQQAQAALPAGVETAIEAAGTDAALVGGLVLVVLVGIMAFKWIRKAM